jgi:hypothetical protein
MFYWISFAEVKHLAKVIIWKLIRKSITVEEFEELKSGNKEIIITVSNLKNAVEYKSLKDFDYAEFCDWIWFHVTISLLWV